MQDLLYYYDKIDFSKHILGEIETSFNQSFVIDGTKDTKKVIVTNYQKEKYQPLSIVKHEATKTWWVIKHDKVGRYVHEGKYLYRHELSLEGAIELFNNRDLTDSGFNQKTYTIREFFTRLIKLTNFELPFTINSHNLIDLDQVVDYTKTYSNYSPLNAMWELFEAYNCSLDLEFNENSSGTITSAIFHVLSKAGNPNRDAWEDDDFDEVNESSSMDKNSFGTTVISNAENVISTKTKTYPTVGSVKLSSSEYTINVSGNTTNAFIRLPSNVFKVNWVKLCFEVKFTFAYIYGGITITETYHVNNNNYEEIFNEISNKLNNVNTSSVRQELLENKDTILAPFKAGVCVSTIYLIEDLDPSTPNDPKFVNPTDNDDFYQVNIYKDNYPTSYDGQVAVVPKQIWDMLYQKQSAMYYERGKDYVSGPAFLQDDNIGTSRVKSFEMTEMYQHSDLDINVKNAIKNGNYYYDNVNGISCKIEFADRNGGMRVFNTSYIVNYIPMSDIKIKIDNSGTGRDTQLYNQNGKLTDSVALSKLMLSHSKEIESEEFTKYRTDYVIYDSEEDNDIYENIPQVGDIVVIDDERYVINNVSLDFEQSESNNFGTQIGYYIKGEYTLSKNVAAKSLMVNPNNNIRDYGIPQDNNVVRKQLYRDFYELSFESDSLADSDYYLPLSKILNIGFTYQDYQEHVAIMEIEFDNAIGGGTYVDETEPPQTKWYFQLNTTSYVMKKSIYEVLNFKDNNIIGYGSQNVYSGFFINRILTGLYDTINVPISYVDTKGRFKGVNIAFCNKEQVETIYADYTNNNVNDPSSLQFPLSNAFCFIDKKVYLGEQATIHIGYDSFVSTDDYEGLFVIYGDEYVKVTSDNKNDLDIDVAITIAYDNYSYNGAKDSNDFMIRESNYEKDALEVPFFEYSCQIDDTDEVIVGENVFDNKEEENYIYCYVRADKNKYSELNYQSIPNIPTPNIYGVLNQGVTMEYVDDELRIKFYDNVQINSNNELIIGTQINFGEIIQYDTNDIFIIRYAFKNGIYQRRDMIFGIRKIATLENVSTTYLPLKINHYKIS